MADITLTDEQRTAWKEFVRDETGYLSEEVIQALDAHLDWLEAERKRLREVLTDISRNDYHRDSLWEICHNALVDRVVKDEH